jgi:hypothetical protein
MVQVKILELHQECQQVVVGPLIFEELERAITAVYRRLAGRLIRDGFDEDEAASSAMAFLVTEPTTGSMSPIREILIRDFQEMKDLGEQMSIGVFRASLRTTVYRHLLTLHPRGYVENLVDRAVEQLSQGRFIRIEWAKSFRYFLRENYTPGLEHSDLPSKDDLSRAVAASAFVEKLPQKQANQANSDPYADVRLSKVYAAAEFSAILDFLVKYADGVSKRQIFDFFQELLTFYRDTSLQPDVTTQGPNSSPDSIIDREKPHSDIDALRAITAAEETWEILSPIQRVIFRMKAEGVADLVIAKSPVLASHNGGSTISRVTVLNIRTEMQQVIKNGLDNLDELEHEYAWNLLLGKAYADGN